MKRLSTVFFVLASAASAAQEARKPLTYIINPWPVLEFHTESTGGTSLLSTNGSVETGAGHDARRLVLDKDDKVIFGYYIEARKTDLGECTIRIKPLEREKNVPTLAAAREFPQLNPGDEAQVDIFYNPRTGEKVYDVIRVASQRASKPEGEQFSLLRCRVDVNGKTIRGTSTFWMIGGALIISLPGRGDYYFGLAPCANTPCRPAAWVDHNVFEIPLERRPGGGCRESQCPPAIRIPHALDVPRPRDKGSRSRFHLRRRCGLAGPGQENAKGLTTNRARSRRCLSAA